MDRTHARVNPGARRGHRATLACHPQSPTDVVRSITALARRWPGGTLALTFVLDADRTQLRIPPPGPARFTHGLWEHTCFEAFIVANGAPAYHELNCAPSGAWAVYAFRRYREIAPRPAAMPAPTITLHRAADRLQLDVTVRIDRLLPGYASVPLRLALAAVIEEKSGGLSYWALRHPVGQPDFHHADAFALRLAIPDTRRRGSRRWGVDSPSDPR